MHLKVLESTRTYELVYIMRPNYIDGHTGYLLWQPIQTLLVYVTFYDRRCVHTLAAPQVDEDVFRLHFMDDSGTH
jgi:hypothetical protein